MRGIDWDYCFESLPIATKIKAGYEALFYPSQILNFTGGAEESDLSLDGLTLQLGVEY